MNERDRKVRALADVTVFIYCDSDRHPRRQVAVTNFARVNGVWVEVPASRADRSGGYVGTGRTIVNDDMPQAGWALEVTEQTPVTRNQFVLECRKCNQAGQRRRRGVPLREETRDRVLEALVASGASRASLAQVAAILASAGRSN